MVKPKGTEVEGENSSELEGLNNRLVERRRIPVIVAGLFGVRLPILGRLGVVCNRRH